jgi:hypothetical protein
MNQFTGDGETEQLINSVYERQALWNKRCSDFAKETDME